jgi:inorganic pyrophosphatase
VLRRFFEDYKQLEKKIVEVEEIASVEMAYPVIEDALLRYSSERQRGF